MQRLIPPPWPQLGYSFDLDDDVFTISLRNHLRMGVLDFVQIPPYVPCPCNARREYSLSAVKCTEAHILGCNYGYGGSTRHEPIKHATRRIAQAAGFNVTVEPPLGLAPLVGARNRGDLSFIGLRSDDIETTIDVSLRNALVKENLETYYPDPFTTVNKGFMDKMNGAATFMTTNTTEFIPAIVDSLGVIHPIFMRLIRSLAAAAHLH